MSAARAQPSPAHLAFAAGLNAALDPGRHGSFVWSPFSVAAALTLLAAGARGATLEDLERLLGGGAAAQQAVLDEAADSAAELRTATALWLQSGTDVLPGFEQSVRARRSAAIHAADFAGAPEGARQAINADIAKTTEGRIPDLLQPGMVGAETVAVLADALWVRVHWQDPFDPAKTRSRPFHAPAATRTVPMMHRQARLPYARKGAWHMATVAGDDELALDIVLPRDPAERAHPDAAQLRALYDAQRPTQVALALPRFELRWRQELQAALDACGAGRVFTSGAELTGITPRPLRLDAMVHESWLRVDERGAEGAAATAAVMTLMSAALPVEFTADRPFLFVLRRRGAVLFLGRVTDPRDPGPAE